MYKEPINPLENINLDIYKKLIEYPISLQQIINCVLKTQNELNEGLNPENNKWYWFAASMKEGAQFGGFYEHELRYRLNKLGILSFIEGEHNSGEDLTCLENPEYSIEVKTRKNLQFNNTNDNNRTHESTKYSDNAINEEHYYILIQHDLNLDTLPYTTTVKRIFFGRLCKSDFTNPNGSGAAYLKRDILNQKCIEIWNSEVGNTIEYYQAWSDTEYSILETELE